METERIPVELSRVDGLSVGQLRSLSNKVGEAAAHFQNERFDEARAILAAVVERYPTIPEVRELHALTLYRLGRWKPAIAQIDALLAMEHSFDLHAVLADCHRALGNYQTVEDLWDELREASPTGDVVTEGRIVAAGALADQGELRSAIRLLEKGPTKPKRPQESTVRLWYALADLHERAGELPLAREGFQRIVSHDPRFGDAAVRLADLR